MAGYGHNQNHTRSAITNYGSKGTVDGYNVGAYGSWYQHGRYHAGAYVDAQLIYSWFDNYVKGDDIDDESYDSRGMTVSATTGYSFALGQSGRPENPTRYFIEPHLQITWMGINADDFTESNGSRIEIKGNNNVQTRTGLRAYLQAQSVRDAGSDRYFQPFIEVNWLHNTQRSAVSMNGVVLEQSGGDNVGELKLGLEGQITQKVEVWGHVGEQLGGEGFNSTTATAGIKYMF
jgi:autotransporter family porin